MRRALIAVSMLVTLWASITRADDVVRLAIGDWEPYTSQSNAKGKLLEKVVTEAFKAEGLSVQYSYFPWKRSYELTASGQYDGTFPWTRTPEREQRFVLNKLPLMREEGVFFHLKSKAFDWNTLDDLKKYKVGVTIGYLDEGVYRQLGIPADPVASEELNFQKMLVGRIDVYQTSKTVGYTLINKMFSHDDAQRFTHHPKPAQVNDYFVLFSKASPNASRHADRFDAGLKKIKASGLYDKIMAEGAGS
ncbi:MAG: ABC transporter substrate-binding protein [Burkholderiales bacterium]|nr:ABC transporter substrate-binding protein [Burkholderiales bacterium]